MSTTLFHSYYTLVMLLVFIGICFWAWSKKRTRFFDEAAQLPFADEEISRHSVCTLQKEDSTHE